MTRALKSALHHWWPRSLSVLWADREGCVTQLTPDGTQTRSKPSNFGAIKNAHHIKFGESNPWNMSFEQAFAKADAQFPDMAEWLLNLDAVDLARPVDFMHRFVGHALSDARRAQLAATLASLIVRSPRSRNTIKRTVEHYREAFGLDDEADKSLIAGNMRGCQEVFERSLRGGGKFVVLFSDAREFIFGDGFLHTFPPMPDPPFHPHCIVPLLPTVTVMFDRPQQSWKEPELVTIRLTADEVEIFNTIVQIYSRDAVFYRSQTPMLSDHFRTRQFIEIAYHKHPWVQRLLAEVARFHPRKVA